MKKLDINDVRVSTIYFAYFLSKFKLLAKKVDIIILISYVRSGIVIGRHTNIARKL